MVTTSGSVRAASLTLIAAFALAACGTDSSKEVTSADPSETASASPEFTLADLVPEAAVVGADFRASDTADAEISPVLRQGLDQCPAALGLIDSIPNPIEQQAFIDSEGRIIEVFIDDGAEPASDSAMTEVGDALGSCAQRTLTLSSARVTITIAGGLDTGVGEQALRVGTTTTARTEDSEVSQNFYLLQFRRGDIGVQLRGLDSVKGGQRIKLDPEVMLAVGDAIDEKLEEALN